MPLALRFAVAPTFALIGVSPTPDDALMQGGAPSLADRRQGLGALMRELRHVDHARR